MFMKTSEMAKYSAKYEIFPLIEVKNHYFTEARFFVSVRMTTGTTPG